MSEKKRVKINDSGQDASDNRTQETADDEKQNPSGETVKPVESPQVEDSVEALKAELQAQKEKTEETYDRLLRVSAEFENYKKRSAREMDEFRKFANQALIRELLSVVDNLELAIHSSRSDQSPHKALLEGLQITHSEILKIFEKFNVTPIVAKGKTFDPNFHEAVMQQETDDAEENTVIDEMQKGYLIHDRLLRPAMVVVAKPKSKETGKT